MSGAPGVPIPPRWGPLTPQRWPQDDNLPPTSGGLAMPPVSASNAERSRRESFTLSGTWAVAAGNASGQVFPLYLPTDADGDFWCDQIYVCGWQPATTAQMVRPQVSTLQIQDARTGRSLTWPNAVPTNFFTTLILFSDDGGFDPSSSPFPDGFRSTTVLPQPFCFTRAGGIQLNLTMIASLVTAQAIDIAFGGWKEYEHASA